MMRRKEGGTRRRGCREHGKALGFPGSWLHVGKARKGREGTAC